MNNIMVCVTKEDAIDTLIEYVYRSWGNEENKIYLVHIGSYEMYYMNKTEEEEELNYLYEKALLCGGDVSILRSNKYLESVAKFIEKNNISRVIIEDTRELRQLKNLESYVLENMGRGIECTFLTI